MKLYITKIESGIKYNVELIQGNRWKQKQMAHVTCLKFIKKVKMFFYVLVGEPHSITIF